MLSRFAAVLIVAALATPAGAADQVDKAPPTGAYKKVSELVKLPDFLPGLGQLFVDPKTLPAARRPTSNISTPSTSKENPA